MRASTFPGPPPRQRLITFQAEELAVAPGPLSGSRRRRHPQGVVLAALQVGDVQPALGCHVGHGWKEKGEKRMKHPAARFYCVSLERATFPELGAWRGICCFN